MSFYAHTHPDFSDPTFAEKYWERLFVSIGEADEKCRGFPHCEKCRSLDESHGHLNKVAWWTARFMEEMFPESSEGGKLGSDWGYLIGLWHDLGKFAPEWQEYLKKKVDPHVAEISEKVDHSTAGAQFAVGKHPALGHLLAFGIAGHHGGLPDAKSNQSCLETRLNKKDIYPTTGCPRELLDRELPEVPEFLKKSNDPFSYSFFVRMLFSCLVDSDFLATESFMNRKQFVARNENDGDCLRKIEALVSAKIAKFGTPDLTDVVNCQRAKVVEDCQKASESEQGLFSMTVPTGGGKTLSSLLFAVRHAIKQGQRRIIYVIPFTSIIEQNADVIREIVAPLETENFTPLVEHHSSIDPESETERSRLASENWDAPIIITTAVQFYESLFAAKTSQTRKLHNISNAVVIFDEAQTLPVNYLKPCLQVIEELTSFYNTTAVLCTATQPEVSFSEDFPIGLKECREIIEDPRSLFSVLKRVSIQKKETLLDDELADFLSETRQSLCIVNRRKHAQVVYRKLSEKTGGEGNYHLSALMCPAHRKMVLNDVRKRLVEKLPVRLVSTQLIEAGVDVDFPVVYRSLAGIDSIAQAAGRCNRNGKMDGLGEVFVFEAEDQKAEKYFKETSQVAAQILELHEDILSPSAVKHYFDLYYHKQKNRWDEKGILDKFQFGKKLPLLFQFKKAAKDFKLIEQEQESILIPFDKEAERLIELLKNTDFPLSSNLFRQLQRYTVQVFPNTITKNSHAFEQIRDGQFTALISSQSNYSKEFGLNFNNETPLIL